MTTQKTPLYVLRSPELGKPLRDFYEACEFKGILDSKTKALLRLICASILYSPDNAKEYMTEAYNAGVSKEEITEALLIVGAETAKRNISWINDITVIPYQNTQSKELQKE